MDTLDRLIGLMKGSLPGISEKEITENTILRDELGIDSLRLVNIIVAIEESFGIEFDEADLNPAVLRRIGDLEALINKTQAKGEN